MPFAISPLRTMVFLNEAFCAVWELGQRIELSMREPEPTTDRHGRRDVFQIQDECVFDLLVFRIQENHW